MGAVYLAEHPLIGKQVALKVIHQDLAARHDVLARFANEARAVARVAGEHVVRIHDFGQAETGESFYVMDYLDGHTLAAEIAIGPVSVERTLAIGAQLARGLSAVHAQDLLHRDLKPDNVMLVERNGRPDFVVLLDFGLVKFLGEGAAASNLTAEGMLLGTPQYMSPEACAGYAVDHRSDQYAVGVLLFQMLTGRLPFNGDSMGAILAQQMGRLPPPLRGINPTIPPSVEQIVLRCLAKAPGQRFASMRSLYEALIDPDAYLQAGPPVMPTEAVVPDAADRPPPDTGAKTRMGLPPVRASASRPAQVVAPQVGPRARHSSHQVEVVVPKERTLPIATPMGHVGTRRRSRGVFLYAFVAIMVVGVVFMALKFADMMDRRHTKRRGAISSKGASASRKVPKVDAGPAEPIDSVIRIRVVTEPKGAAVHLEGVLLGRTPFTSELPMVRGKRTIKITHPEAMAREKTFDGSRDVEIDLELAPLEVPPRKRRKERRTSTAPEVDSEATGDVLRPSF